MKIDATLIGPELRQVASLARLAEDIGFDALFTAETQHDPFLPLAVAAEHTGRIGLGTAIALAFPRSPMTLAHTANDLQDQSQGRFVLGLGSQVKAHVEKRFSATFDPPVQRMREIVQALRAIWQCWQDGTRLAFRGEYYRHTLMTPFFTPPAHPYGAPKIFLSAVGPRMTELAGEVADGVILHGFTTDRYLNLVTLPALERGLRRSGRTWTDFEVVVPGFVVTGADDLSYARAERQVREAIAFYGSTPAYRAVLETHGWGELQDELNALARRGRWAEMSCLVDDEMIDAFAVRGEPKELPERLVTRYGAICRRIILGVRFHDDPGTWATLVDRVHNLTSEPLSGLVGGTGL